MQGGELGGCPGIREFQGGDPTLNIKGGALEV